MHRGSEALERAPYSRGGELEDRLRKAARKENIAEKIPRSETKIKPQG